MPFDPLGAQVPRFLPSLKDLLPLLIGLAVLSTGQRLLDDADTGWHIRTGQLLLQSGFLDRDPFSFSAPGGPWFAFEWLCDVGMALLHRMGGLQALVGASALLLALTFAVVQRLGLALGGQALVTFGLTLLGAAVSTIHWLARPHLLSFLMTALFVTVLEVGHPGRSRRLLFAQVPLMVLWCNLHGAFLAGFLILGAYLVGACLPGSPQRWARRDLALVLASCALATLINPHGFHLHLHLVEFLGKTSILRHIDEYQPPDFQTASGQLLEVWLLLIVLGLGPMLRQRDWPRIFLLLGLSHMTLTSHRHVDLLVVASAPLLASAFGKCFQGARLGRFETLEKAQPGLWGPIAVLLAVLLIPTADQFSPSKFPVQAAAKLEALGLKRVLSNDTYGGYLIYCCWPRVRVFVDGRCDYYSTSTVFEDFLAMITLAPDWVQRIQRYQPDSVLLPRQHRALRWLLLEGGWVKVHEDETAALLVRAPG